LTYSESTQRCRKEEDEQNYFLQKIKIHLKVVQNSILFSKSNYNLSERPLKITENKLRLET